MRILVLVALLALPLSARAASVDPSALVVQQADVPAGFHVDRSQTGVRSNAEEAKREPRARMLFARWRRVTGYEIVYDRGADGINSRADLFEAARGARALLAFYDGEMRMSGISGLVRSEVGLGAGGWLYTGRAPAAFVLVVWRRGRVCAGLATIGLSRARTLRLARAQDHRVTAALR